MKKSPKNDGFAKKFYETIWNDIKNTEISNMFHKEGF